MINHSSQKRSVLGDITNITTKRGSSSASSDSWLNSGNSHGKKEDGRDGDSRAPKKKKYFPAKKLNTEKSGAESNRVALPTSKDKDASSFFPIYMESGALFPNMPREKEKFNLFDGNEKHSVMEIDNLQKDDCVSTIKKTCIAKSGIYSNKVAVPTSNEKHISISMGSGALHSNVPSENDKLNLLEGIHLGEETDISEREGCISTVKEKAISESGEESNKVTFPTLTSKHDFPFPTISMVSGASLPNAPPNECEKKFNLLDGVHLVGHHTSNDKGIEDTPRFNFVSTVMVSQSSESNEVCNVGGISQDEKEEDNSGLIELNHVNDILVEKDLVGKLDSSNYGFNALTRVHTLGDSRPPGLERCSGLKGDRCTNLNTNDDILKSCSCSFCLKAAYIWSDLHYQDIKGRISALKRSQKEASILANSCRPEKITYHGEGSSSDSKQIELDLSAQWTILFRHMEHKFAREGNDLQVGFESLKELRESCKMNLAKINEMPSEKQ